MFHYFYYPLPFFLNSIFSLFLIVFLGLITPYIIILANKNEDYKKKKFFIIYEKAISILLILHIILTLINLPLINFILNLFIGVIGIAIIYGICHILDKNNIAIDKSIMSKIYYTIGKIFFYIEKMIKTIFSPIIVPIAIPICILIFIFYKMNYNIDLQSFLEKIINNINSEYMPILLSIAIILAAIFCLFFILIFVVIMINSMIAIINQKLDKINKNIENNKSAFSSELETTKKDNNDNDYII